MRLSTIKCRLASFPTPCDRPRETGGCFLRAAEHILPAALAFAVLCGCLCGQTSSTGALAGRVLDPSGALIPGTEVRLTNPDSGYFRSEISDGGGNFHFLLLLPGRYELQADKTGFAPDRINGVNVLVTETLQLELHLRLAAAAGSVQASSTMPMESC